MFFNAAAALAMSVFLLFFSPYFLVSRSIFFEINPSSQWYQLHKNDYIDKKIDRNPSLQKRLSNSSRNKVVRLEQGIL